MKLIQFSSPSDLNIPNTLGYLLKSNSYYRFNPDVVDRLPISFHVLNSLSQYTPKSQFIQKLKKNKKLPFTSISSIQKYLKYLPSDKLLDKMMLNDLNKYSFIVIGDTLVLNTTKAKLRSKFLAYAGASNDESLVTYKNQKPVLEILQREYHGDSSTIGKPKDYYETQEYKDYLDYLSQNIFPHLYQTPKAVFMPLKDIDIEFLASLFTINQETYIYKGVLGDPDPLIEMDTNNINIILEAHRVYNLQSQKEAIQ